MRFAQSVLMLSLVAFLFIGASLKIEGNDPEVKVPPLQMLCPYDKFVFYDIDLHEDQICQGMEWQSLEKFLHPREGIPPFRGNYKGNWIKIQCPICGESPFRSINKWDDGGAQIYTNKGWLPDGRC